MPHVLPQSPLIDGTDLLKQDHRIFTQPDTATGNVNMGRQSGFSGLAGDRRGDHRWGMAITGIVLYDQYRTRPPLLTANHRG